MPLWEAYTLLLALQLWTPIVVERGRNLRIIGDAQGVLRAVVAKRARHPQLNLAIAEMKLVLAPCAFALEAEHIWSEKNAIADQLSRLSEVAPFPETCKRAKRDAPLTRRYKFLGSSFNAL